MRGTPRVEDTVKMKKAGIRQRVDKEEINMATGGDLGGKDGDSVKLEGPPNECVQEAGGSLLAPKN